MTRQCNVWSCSAFNGADDTRAWRHDVPRSPPIRLGGLGVSLHPTARLGHTFTYIADLDSRWAPHRHNDMGYFIKSAKSYSWTHFLLSQYLCLNLFSTGQHTTSSIITSRGLHVSCYTAPTLIACYLFFFVYCLCTILFLYVHELGVKFTFCSVLLWHIFQVYHTMHGNDLSHVWCFMGHASVAMHPMLVGYGLVRLSG
jgi:hypothetical protein